jgi:5-dehydro-2-deoxygluconokinase
MMTKTYDVLCMGRSTLDLFGATLNADFADQTAFNAYVGGSPTNICVAAQRLGLKSALLTGVGDNFVASFLKKFLNREGVAQYLIEKPGFQTNTVAVALQPPDEMQFVPYPFHNADLQLTIADVRNAPIADCRTFLFTGMCLIQDPSRSATHFAAETAREHGAKVFMDLDYRTPMWTDEDTYGVTARITLPLVDIALGNESEIRAAGGRDTLEATVERLLSLVREAIIVKRGANGSTVYTRDGAIYDIAPHNVNVVNMLGAGDAYAGGFLYGYLNGWTIEKAAQLGSACGAFIVAEHGTANAMPTLEQALAYLED